MTELSETYVDALATVRRAFAAIPTADSAELIDLYFEANGAAMRVFDFVTADAIDHAVAGRARAIDDERTPMLEVMVRQSGEDRRRTVDARTRERADLDEALRSWQSDAQPDPTPIAHTIMRIAENEFTRGNHVTAAEEYDRAAQTIQDIDPERAKSLRSLAEGALATAEAVGALRAERIAAVLPGLEPAGADQAIAGLEPR